ncbi:MAG: PEP-CTERM sorting domain-containing protein [Nitrospiraceae bacterium]|nr:PEP-CTERM sorting domain-containing protein [Nitrospiraceae bacterium]
MKTRLVLRHRILSQILCFMVLAGCLSIAGTSHATVLGEIWLNQPENGSSGLLSTVPVTTPDAEFNTSAINYDSRVTGYTPALFFNNPTFFNTSGAFNPNGSLDDTLALFTGQTYLNAGNNTFTTTHDDGFELSVPGVGFDLQQGGPFPPTPITYTITAPSAGLYDFSLSYFEGWGPPATLNYEVNGVPVGVPEPSTFVLLLVGAASFAVTAVYRKKMTA